jgi:hypothetical protein
MPGCVLGGGRRRSWFLGEVETVRHVIGRCIARIQSRQAEDCLAEFDETDVGVQSL